MDVFADLEEKYDIIPLLSPEAATQTINKTDVLHPDGLLVLLHCQQLDDSRDRPLLFFLLLFSLVPKREKLLDIKFIFYVQVAR